MCLHECVEEAINVEKKFQTVAMLTIIQLIFKGIERPAKQQLIEYFAANSEAWSRKESFRFAKKCEALHGDGDVNIYFTCIEKLI